MPPGSRTPDPCATKIIIRDVDEDVGVGGRKGRWGGVGGKRVVAVAVTWQWRWEVAV